MKHEYRIFGKPVDIKNCKGYIPIVKTQNVSTGLIPTYLLIDENITISRFKAGQYQSEAGQRYFAIELVEYEDDGYECEMSIMGFLVR